MGREVRRVPADWVHPKENKYNWKMGQQEQAYKPLLGGSYANALAEWLEGREQWSRGYVSDFHGGWQAKTPDAATKDWEDYWGDAPQFSAYMPDWPEAERTHWQMYEDTTEGTPISPVMPDPKSLAHWLADNEASSFGKMTATYEQWLATIQQGWAPSALFSESTGLISGVAAAAKEKE